MERAASAPCPARGAQEGARAVPAPAASFPPPARCGTVPRRGRRNGGVGGSASPAGASRASTGGAASRRLRDSAAGARAAREAPAGRWRGRAAFSEVSQGGECGRRGRSRRAAGGLRHRGHAPEAANLPPCKARPGDLAEPGARLPPHRASNATGRPSRLWNDTPGPSPSRESSCPATGGATVAPTACPAGDAAPVGALRRWCGRCTRAGRPSRHVWRCG